MKNARPVLDPKIGRWPRAFTEVNEINRTAVILVLSYLGAVLAGIGLIASGVLALQLMGALVEIVAHGAMGHGVVQAIRHSVGPPSWDYKGQPIVGEARQVLTEAMVRATEAEDFIAEIPTKLDWKQFRPDVDALLWDAAGHAAEVSKLNAELNRYRYAEPGTAQGVVRTDLLERRASHLAVVSRARDAMTELASAAGNAAAAARVALERTGSVQSLEVVSPSAARIVAEGGLDEAREQLDILAETWAELDTSVAGLAAALERDVATQSTKRARRARRSPPPTDRRQEG
jgi:hypothetical protein